MSRYFYYKMASSSGGIALRLEALEYPHRASFRADDDASLAQCVAWLENRKVRHYQQGAARAHLLGSSVQPGLPGVARYLVDLGCPHEWLDADAAETAETRRPASGQSTVDHTHGPEHEPGRTDWGTGPEHEPGARTRAPQPPAASSLRRTAKPVEDAGQTRRSVGPPHTHATRGWHGSRNTRKNTDLHVRL